jgi:integrase/recombinase XerD
MKNQSSVSPNSKNAKFEATSIVPDLQSEDLNQADFATPIQITKSEAARKIASILRRARVDYEGSKALVKDARRIAGLKPTKTPKKQPRLLTGEELKNFFAAVDKGGDLQHKLMTRILFYSGVRVSELANLRRSDIDIERCTIRVEQGKGSKDRTTLFPESLKLAISAYLDATPNNVYLFESGRCSKYTPRRIQQIVAKYADAAGLQGKVHVHLFRHQCLSTLTRAKLSDTQIQLLSGHASKKSLEVYQHLSLSAVSDDYQRAMAGQIV